MNNLKKNIAVAIAASAILLFPLASLAQLAPLVQTGVTPSVSLTQPAVDASPLLCYDFGRSLRLGNKGEAVRLLQYFLITKEAANIDLNSYGTFDQTTVDAVKAFQEKYADLLTKLPRRQSTGTVLLSTRQKLKALYGCQTQISQSAPAVAAPAPTLPTNVILAVTDIQLDSNGVTATFCNKGPSDIPTAPFRIRLNGINRDFEVIGAEKAGACDTESLPYSSWGLSFDPGVTFSAVSIIDPFNFYKKSSLQFPTSGTTTLSAPAITGAQLSVRSVTPKTTGIQATLCNLGSVDVTSFPVRVTVNGTPKDLDAASAYKSGKCVTINWTYDTWGLTFAPGTAYTVTVQVDPNNVIKETNEFDNAATVIGTP